jgi:hypothetical protein
VSSLANGSPGGTLILGVTLRVGNDLISRSTHRTDEPAADLATQVEDVHLDRIALDFVAPAVQRLLELPPADRPVAVSARVPSARSSLATAFGFSRFPLLGRELPTTFNAVLAALKQFEWNIFGSCVRRVSLQYALFPIQPPQHFVDSLTSHPRKREHHS